MASPVKRWESNIDIMKSRSGAATSVARLILQHTRRLPLDLAVSKQFLSFCSRSAGSLLTAEQAWTMLEPKLAARFATVRRAFIELDTDKDGVIG